MPWKQNKLAKRLIALSESGTDGVGTNQAIRYLDTLHRIWEKALPAFPRAQWQGWVDHTQHHVINVISNLSNLVTERLLTYMGSQEIFVLLASSILHDIGMIISNDQTPQDLIITRQQHGKKGREIIKEQFASIIDNHVETQMICEIVENHHGDFIPKVILNQPYLAADALMVRLADELDFGADRAPTWLLEYVNPKEKQLQHWKEHINLDPPYIDNRLFRIQVRGKIESKAFIHKLRKEFEDQERISLQSHFLNRHQDDIGVNSFYMIWDCTVEREEVDQHRFLDERPSIFGSEQFFLAARYLYNTGQFHNAKKVFEQGVKDYPEKWFGHQPSFFLYHYLQTFNKLGQFQEVVDFLNSAKTNLDSLPAKTQAALNVTKLIAYWKLERLSEAQDVAVTATLQYQKLSGEKALFYINVADAYTLQAIIKIEKALKKNIYIEEDEIHYLLITAKKFYKKFKNDCVSKESHYMGRYWGAEAFFGIYRLNKKLTHENATRLPVDDWHDIKLCAKKSFGGKKGTNRILFGILSGKYCNAAVNYHLSRYCEDRQCAEQALSEAAESIIDTIELYISIYNEEYIHQVFNKIYTLGKKIHESINTQSQIHLLGKKIEPLLSKIDYCGNSLDSIVLFSPIN